MTSAEEEHENDESGNEDNDRSQDERHYYYQWNGETKGPVSAKEIQSKLSTNEFDGNTRIWCSDYNDWKKISETEFAPSNSTVSPPPLKQTDPFAIVTFAAGLGGFVLLPIIFVPIGYIAALVSYHRLKENENLQGNIYRIIGAILVSINLIWLLYKYGFFS